MGSRRTSTVRFARRALVLTAAAGVIFGGGSAWRAHADDVSGPSTGGADCVTGWNSTANVAAIGQGLLFPYENLVGEPYAETVFDDTPHSKSKASMAYEGFVGAVVLGTSNRKLGPDNPTSANAYYPPPAEGGYGGVHDAHDFGPFGKTEAYDRPDKSYADARTGFVTGGEQLSVGPSFAHSDVAVGQDGLTGIDRAAAYDIHLGSLHIALATTDLVWKDNGSTAGTVATWKTELHGVEIDGKPVFTSSGDGFSFNGQSPQPGPAAHKQSNDQFKQFSDAINKGGGGRYSVVLQDGSFSASDGTIDIDEVGLKIEAFPDPLTKGGSLRGANIQFARLVNHTNVSRGPCDAVKQMPEWTDKTPPSGPNLPPYPPPPSGQHPVTSATVAHPALPALPAPAAPVVTRPVPVSGGPPAILPALGPVTDILRSAGGVTPPAPAAPGTGTPAG
ncbi:MAG TPA: hypothetical protein VMU20_13080 [Candidatus Dormibacteraeota bacterium]|nr:hypothetical protein [Candidatus Dormibacteraeota bacterium]